MLGATRVSSPGRLRKFYTTCRALTPNRFFVYAPDYPNSVARRYAVRETHLAGVKESIENGVIRVGGMLVDPNQPMIEAEDRSRRNATGSILIVEAETIENVRELVENDIYWKGGVWDKDKLTIQPFYAATPFP